MCTLPRPCFAKNSRKDDGLQTWCRDCHKMSRCADTDSTADSEPKRQRVESSLYLLRIAGDVAGAFGLKIGRTGDLSERTKALENAVPFRVEVLAEFPGAGHLESTVHAFLDTRRNTDGRGREWFRVPLPEALHAVACVMAGSINSANAAEAPTAAACRAAFATSASKGFGPADALARGSATMDSDST